MAATRASTAQEHVETKRADARADLVEEVRGIEFVPIDFEIADDLGRWRVEIPGKA